ncbi:MULTISPECIES: winged helix-turn-helix transcriptional regulator [Frankia]|uniref:Transcriptional regulator (Partial match) n=1 Tax=Frankia alni (strain DSM 45986 / CECT 9034 / ACN14a) TaxID=326424 RepID=Q0RG58_FRAAA|nr:MULTISPECIES: helix-turn-helix domain-containing protein [Frankia]CAJ63531.1 Putative transcriptional regulator (partial match) [Frankia alni ACN14a]
MTTRTAAQRRAEAKVAYDAFMAACPSRKVFEMLSDKWVGLVLAAVSAGPRRYGELKAEIAGVSPKMLTQTLRTLERSGLVDRTVTASVPVRVDYELTPLGRDLYPLITPLKAWAEANVDAIRAAEQAYDLRTFAREPTGASAATGASAVIGVTAAMGVTAARQ